MIALLRRFWQRLARILFMTTRPLRRLTSGLTVGVVIAVILALALWLDLFSTIRTRLTDSLFQPRPTTGIVTIVAIDDASLATYGRSTVEWPRTVHADLIDRLTAAGARVIAFDVLFADPTPDDAMLAESMSQARNVVEPVAGSYKNVTPTTQAGKLISYDQFVYPTPVLKDAAFALGHVNIVPDSDGQVRRVPLVVMDGDQPVPALGLAAYMTYLRLPAQFLMVEQGAVKLANRTLFTDSIGRMIIYYFGPPSMPNQPGTFPVYSLVDVVNGKVPPEAFKDKIVLIGALNATGLPDSYATPGSSTGAKMYGVEIHANIIETIHESLPNVPGVQNSVDWKLGMGPLSVTLYKGAPKLPLREQPLNQQILITVLMALVASGLLPFVRWYAGLVVVVLGYLAYFFWASASFTIWGRIVDLLFPAFALGFSYVGTLIVVYLFEERRRGQIHDLFSRYVSAEIAQKIVEAFDEGKLELGGEEREITVLFADIRGFTTLSEGLTPPEVVTMLNIFLEQMTTIVMEHGGAINKYIGDNLMAFWNAPYPMEDHAWQAVQAGLDMLAAIQKLNDQGAFKTRVQFGIGITTGPVVVGNIGSHRRLEYTPIGDTVNTASRMCGVAPGGTCYIGLRCFELMNGRVTPVEVHHLKLKGKAEPVEIYELRPEGWQAAAPAASTD